MPRPEHIEDVILEIHAGDGKGQWFTWTDSKNKIYDNFVVIDDSKEKPTEAFLESELVRLQAEWDANEYAIKREREYPLISDLIVALWENVVEERASAVISLEADRQAVKTKYPKP